MCIVTIDKENTLLLAYSNQKVNANKNRYEFITSYQIKCLGCLDEMFISYELQSNYSIFCDKCKHKANYPNVVQYQYIKSIKEKQVALFSAFQSPVNRHQVVEQL